MMWIAKCFGGDSEPHQMQPRQMQPQQMRRQLAEPVDNWVLCVQCKRIVESEKDAEPAHCTAIAVAEVASVGLGPYIAYQAIKIDGDDSEEERDSGSLRQDMEREHNNIKRVVDVQPSLAALFAQGTSTANVGLDQLQKKAKSGLEAVLGSIDDDDVKRHAQDLKTRLDVVVEAYDAVVGGLLTVADCVSQGKRVPELVKEAARGSMFAARTLYAWAKKFGLDRLSGEAASPNKIKRRIAKLETLPYVVAMAFAVRVEMDARALLGEAMAHEEDRVALFQEIHGTADEFVALVETVLGTLTAGTSLLEIALDYHWHLALYVTLVRSFRTGADMKAVSDFERKEMNSWDDGLSVVRKLLYRTFEEDDGNNRDHRVQLDSLAEVLWWLQFTGADTKNINRQMWLWSFDLIDIIYALGESDSDDVHTIKITNDRKDNLLKLPPAPSLRSALLDKLDAIALAAALGDDFARTRTIREVRRMPRPAPSLLPQFHGRLERTLTGHSDNIDAVAVCSGGQRVVSGSLDKSVKVWRLSDGTLQKSMTGHTSAVRAVAMSPDGARVASASEDKTVRVWNVGTGTQEHVFQGHAKAVQAVAFAVDGRRVISGSYDKTVKVWKLGSSVEETTLRGHDSYVYCVAVSPDGDTVVSGSHDKTVRVWSMRARAQTRLLSGHTGGVLGVAVSPDGQRVASGGGGDYSVRVWSLATGNALCVLTGHSTNVRSLAFFPDGRRVASGSDANTVKVWDAVTKAVECTLAGHTSYVFSVAVSPDGQRVVSGSHDNSIKVWV